MGWYGGVDAVLGGCFCDGLEGECGCMKYLYDFSLMVYCHISDYVLFSGL